jgi:hypothetical protein
MLNIAKKILPPLIWFILNLSSKGHCKGMIDATTGVNDGWLTVSFDFKGFIDRDWEDILKNGLTNTISISIGLKSLGMKDPIVTRDITFFIRYEVWENFFILIKGQQVDSERKILRRIEELRDEIYDVSNFPIERIDRLSRKKRYYLHVTVALNPLSEQIVNRARSYIVNPAGYRSIEKPRSFFGSIASIFLKEDRSIADRLLDLESNRFKLPQ